MDESGKLVMFSLSIIHGPCKGLRFAAQHPRKLLPATVGKELPPATADENPPDKEHQPLRCIADKEQHTKRVLITRTQPSGLLAWLVANKKKGEGYALTYDI